MPIYEGEAVKTAARNCWIWAAILFVVGILLSRFDTEVIDVFNRAIGPDNYEATKWVIYAEGQVRGLVDMTAAVLIGAGAVIQAIAPRAASLPVPDARVDASA